MHTKPKEPKPPKKPKEPKVPVQVVCHFEGCGKTYSKVRMCTLYQFQSHVVVQLVCSHGHH